MAISRRTLLSLGLAGIAGAVGACSTGSRTAGTNRPSRSGPTAPGSSSVGSPSSGGSPSTSPTSASSPSAAAAPSIARQIAHGSRGSGMVALTFHGAGDPAIARDLLDILAAHKAHVTVMAVGTWLAANPDLAGLIVGHGHELGNHTYRHLDINSLPEHEARAEIVRCRDVLTSLISSPGAYFRQSQAPTATPLVRRLAAASGYPVCLSYDLDSMDWTDPGPQAVRANVRRADGGAIVSMHFGHPGTVAALPGILDDLAARNLAPVTAGTLLAAR